MRRIPGRSRGPAQDGSTEKDDGQVDKAGRVKGKGKKERKVGLWPPCWREEKKSECYAQFSSLCDDSILFPVLPDCAEVERSWCGPGVRTRGPRTVHLPVPFRLIFILFSAVALRLTDGILAGVHFLLLFNCVCSFGGKLLRKWIREKEGKDKNRKSRKAGRAGKNGRTAVRLQGLQHTECSRTDAFFLLGDMQAG